MDEEEKRGVISEDTYRQIAELLGIPHDEIQQELESYPELLQELRSKGLDDLMDRINIRFEEYKTDSGEDISADPHTLAPSLIREMATRTTGYMNAAAKRGAGFVESLPKVMFRMFLLKLSAYLGFAVAFIVMLAVLFLMVKFVVTEYYCAGLVWVGDNSSYERCDAIRSPVPVQLPPNINLEEES